MGKIVVHAAWIHGPDRFALWAEDGERLDAAVRGRRTRSSRSSEPHPFALVAEGVRLAATEIGGFGTEEVIAGASETQLVIDLPASGGRPIASPGLEHDAARASPEQAASDEPTRSWSVPAILLDPAGVAQFLLALPPADLPGLDSDDGVVPAFDLRFASRSVELIMELATRGRVLPALERDGDGWRARWRPFVDSRDRGRIEMLLWALPRSFIAANGGGIARHAPDGGGTPGEILRSFMWSVTDALVRGFGSGLSPTKPTPASRQRRGITSDAVGAWLDALRSADGKVRGRDDELSGLSEALEAWHATADTEAESVRTCFRIVPPAADEDDPESRVPKSRKTKPPPGDEWRVEFALQAVDDPSLIVSAEIVWEDGPELTALERHAIHPDEHLLRGLGRAARLVPSIGSALIAAMPSALVTDSAGALEFLSVSAPILEEAGFGVLAPPWWRSSRARVSLRLKSSTPSVSPATSGGIGLDALCTVEWEAALGDDPIGMAELRQLARLKQPLVRFRGQWVELRENDIAAAIEAVTTKRTESNRITAGEVLQTALGLAPASGSIPISAVEADGWLGNLLAGADDHQLSAIQTPVGFVGELRGYQERGLGWLAFLGALGLGACLADDMGLGKTAQLLALILEERAKTKGPTLVICPTSVVGNWQREAERFAPELDVYVHHGADRLVGKTFTKSARKVDLVLSTYGLAARDQQLLSTVPWNRLVLDEAQQIKNSGSRTSRSVRAIPAQRRIAMTGTPVENRLSELWSIMQFLNPGLLGSEKGFRERFAIPIERDGDDEVAAKLRRMTRPFVLRRLKTDRSIITDLPDKIEMKEFCTLTREQASLYQAVVDDMLARIEEAEGIGRRGLVLATMMKLKQVCNHPAHFLADGSALPGRSGKLTRLVEVLQEATSEGDKALVFTQFAEMGNLLERHLRRHLGCDVMWLHGGVAKKARDQMVDDFQAKGGPGVFLLSLKAGGTGLNLTAATHVVHFDRWWNPAVEDQATDRAFRIGQKRNVQVRKFVCAGTLEERIDAMIESKRALAERIVGKSENWITEISTEEIREIVSLSADAVGED